MNRLILCKGRIIMCDKITINNMNTITKKIEVVSIGFLVIVLALFLAHVPVSVSAATFAPLSNQVGPGEQGQNVTNLQTFLASNFYIYPEGRITGYYGSLTTKAVAQFQISYGLPPVGRVGPLTLTKINSIIASGLGLDISASTIANVSLQKSRTSATINWTTNESAKGKVYYSALPLQLGEATGSFMEPVIIGGASNVENQNMLMSQSLTMQNLQPNTLYHYMIVSTDNSGNVSVSVPSSFMTNL